MEETDIPTIHHTAGSQFAHPGEQSSRRSVQIELWGAYALILITIWSPRPAQRWFYWSALLWVIACSWRSFPGWAAFGFRRTGFARSLWVPAMALCVIVVASALAKHFGTLHHPHGVIGWTRAFAGYVLWALMQQFLLQSYFFRRFEEILHGRWIAVLASASIFSLAHLPNPILTSLTFIWGVCACLLFQRHRNLLPLAAAHALLGICVAITVPAPIIHNMRVGLGYLRYRAPQAAPAIIPPKAS